MLLAFFVSLPSLGTMIVEGPVAHWQAFTWTFIGAALLYANFAWFREQLCLIVCPYGRLQSILTDDDSLVVGYDTARGEPRGHKKKNDSTPLGDCVDCNRCVAVCPTGIDIRHGLQVDCIACTQCIDACDDVMTKLGRPRGLVRYDSLRGLRGEPRRFFRPRLILYAILGAAGLAAVSIALLGHHQFEANLLRAQGAPFVREGEILRNTFDIHLVNKRDSAQTLHIETAEAPPGAEVRVAQTAVELEALGGARVPVVVLIPLAEYSTGMQLVMRVSDGEDEIRLEAPLLGPIRIP